MPYYPSLSKRFVNFLLVTREQAIYVPASFLRSKEVAGIIEKKKEGKKKTRFDVEKSLKKYLREISTSFFF